jgi:hypothetical protein
MNSDQQVVYDHLVLVTKLSLTLPSFGLKETNGNIPIVAAIPTTDPKALKLK